MSTAIADIVNRARAESRTSARDDTGWPAPLRDVAYHGIVGRIVRTIRDETEADPVALLLQGLVWFGAIIGRAAHWQVAADTHYLNLFALTVGATAKGRKGVAEGHIRSIYDAVDDEWRRHIASGLSSGEGLIYTVRDPLETLKPVREKGAVVRYESVTEDAGVADKRVLVIEGEFAAVLKVLTREGNTLSSVIRNAWDGRDLRTLTRNSPMCATAPHISIVGHITQDELRRYLDATECGNGFANRFLFVCVRRSKLLPDGGLPVNIDTLIAALRDRIDHARSIGRLQRDPAARELWHAEYRKLTADRPGLLGAVTGRAEAQVMRLACLYALTDGDIAVRVDHLRAALELWRYCYDSAAYIFGTALGDPTADTILASLRRHWPACQTRTEIHNLFGRNKPAPEITRALEVLLTNNLARMETTSDGKGRPTEQWWFIPAEDRR